MKRLEGKNAIITGSNRGIGNAVVKKFASEGANIWAFARRQTEEFETSMRHLADINNVRIVPVYCDMSSEEEIKKAFMSVYRSHERIDILANIAGITQNETFMRTTMAAYRHIFDVNFFGSVYLTQLVLKRMIKDSGGSIINMASWSAEGSAMTESAYGPSKSALVGFTRHLAAEVGRYNIRVNAVEPGAIETDMMEGHDEDIQYHINRCALNRIGRPDEVANVCAFLASDESSYVNGTIIPVNGGRR